MTCCNYTPLLGSKQSFNAYYMVFYNIVSALRKGHYSLLSNFIIKHRDFVVLAVKHHTKLLLGNTL